MRDEAAEDNVRGVIAELQELDDLGAELSRRARSAGSVLIWRAQQRLFRSVVVRDGRAESTSAISVAGHGAQVVNEDGYTALASRDDLRTEPALALLRQVIETAAAGEKLGLRRAVLPDLDPVRARRLPGEMEAFSRIDLDKVSGRLAELEREVAGRVPGVTLKLAYRADLDAWRVFRSDGTDVLFAMPRCSLSLRATGDGDGSRHGVSAVAFDPNPDVPWSEATVASFLVRAEQAARLARVLPDAPTHPAGSFPLVIDYALAKGLAHEAFGHAAEADGYRSSVLARDGRFRSGERVGADHVSIIDEPLEGDHAWQPFSANGVPPHPGGARRARPPGRGTLRPVVRRARRRAADRRGARRIVPRRAPASDEQHPHSRSPIPRPAPGEFEDYGPEQVRDLLAGAGIFRRHPAVVYLSGYAGGQVNTASGDFVFHCKAIYDLGPDHVRLHQPAIFSGSMFGALESVREAFGPLEAGRHRPLRQVGPERALQRREPLLPRSRPPPSGPVWEGARVRIDPLLDAIRRISAPAARGFATGRSASASPGGSPWASRTARPASAHTPLRMAQSCGARYLLVWEDGKVSRGSPGTAPAGGRHRTRRWSWPAPPPTRTTTRRRCSVRPGSPTSYCWTRRPSRSLAARPT